MIEPGSPAPEFTLRDQDADKVSLSDFRGRKVVLAFYPAAFSQVCSDQLSVYAEVLDELGARGAELIGISTDAVPSLKAFQERLGAPIRLLSDFNPRGTVAEAYGAFIPERGHTNRSLVLVDEEGIVRWSYESPPLEVPGANLIFDALEEAGASV